MKAIGGFFGLELPAARSGFHAGAVALSSGRACWHAVLQQVRPRRALVPFYLCDSVLEPLVAAGVECTFYSISDRWLPEQAEPHEEDVLLAVNYFGLLSAEMQAFAERYPGRTVIDDTQAYFRKGSAASWSFNSARKFFGVPDGGYLYGPLMAGHSYPASTTGDCDHLLSGAADDGDEALRQYREHESRIGVEVRAMSSLSERLLASVDVEAVCAARRANFSTVHARLGSRNRTAMALGQHDADVPLCYPFLPDAPITHASLWQRQVFVPQYWPEVSTRQAVGFDRERRLATELIPLPIDQRYGSEDMTIMCDRVLDALSR